MIIRSARWVACLLVLALFLPTTTLAADDSFHLEKAYTLSQSLADTASSDVLVSLLANDATYQDYMRQFGVIQGEAPAHAILFHSSFSSLLSAVMYGYDEEELFVLDDLPATAQKYLQRMDSQMVFSLLSATDNLDQYITSLYLSASEAYPAPDGFEATSIILQFDDCPFATLTTFIPFGDGIISAHCRAVTLSEPVSAFLETGTPSSIGEAAFLALIFRQNTIYHGEELENLILLSQEG